MELTTVKIAKPDEVNVILGMSHFIKTVEDLHEALAGSVPGIKFGLAFCEASGARLVRCSGTDPEMVELAARNAQAIGAGHSFLVCLAPGFFPLNVLKAVQAVPEVVSILAATANPLEVVVAVTEQGRGILGVIDGQPPVGVEDAAGRAWRFGFLRKIGYKAGT